MFEHKKVQSLEDFFVELNKRREQGVYFCRINGHNEYSCLTYIPGPPPQVRPEYASDWKHYH